MTEVIVPVALPVPLYSAFDYRVDAAAVPAPGCRVRVPFGRRRLVGVVCGAPQPLEVTSGSYKPVEAILDETPLLPPELIALCQWVADYYQHPLGEVFAAAVPGTLRHGRQPAPRSAEWLQRTDLGTAALALLSARATGQRTVLEAFAAGPRLRAEILGLRNNASALLRRCLDAGWVEPLVAAAAPPTGSVAMAPELTSAQAQALTSLRGQQGFVVSLLEGVTGSGKTEVYLRRLADVLAQGGQALMLVPEIGLTPQLLERVRSRFGGQVSAFHSGLTEVERARVWLAAREGEARIVIGTRSAVFVPLPRLQLIVVDEEHDASFKQQEGLAYSARDVAIVRAQALGAQVVLGTATPSLETLFNARSGRYAHLHLAMRVREQAVPRIGIVDLRGQTLRHGLSRALTDAVERHLAERGQVLLFINRRGYAPALLCHDCGWVGGCKNCDARLTLHRSRKRLICHHCGALQAVPTQCPQCRSTQLLPIGHGTERLEEGLTELFPQARIERVDSDRLRRAGELEGVLQAVHDGSVDILVGTQILAKGHDFAGLTLVGVVSVDQALYSADFRSMERMGQLLTQVAGRAGRGERPGEVLLQTHEPEHPMLTRLIRQGYVGLAEALLHERQQMKLPPYAHLALLRAECEDAALCRRFLEDARKALGEPPQVQAMGPVPAPMERRAGRFREHLLLHSHSRTALRRALHDWVRSLDKLPQARKLRWALDVDPVDLF